MDSNELRILGYVGLVVLAVLARLRERTRATADDGAWPEFWWMTIVFLAVMAIGRAGDIGGLIGELGREQAVESGWYDGRRRVQAGVVGGVGVIWFFAVLIALWRTPERRRRYLPMGIVVATIGAFAAVRVVSLHQVDAVLYRRHIGPVRIGTIAEWCLLTAAALTTCWVPRGNRTPILHTADRNVTAHP